MDNPLPSKMVTDSLRKSNLSVNNKLKLFTVNKGQLSKSRPKVKILNFFIPTLLNDSIINQNNSLDKNPSPIQ